MPLTAQHAQAFVLACLCFVLVGCPIGDQTIFYQVRGSVFSAQDVPANHVMVSAISLSWHPESALKAFANHSVYRTKMIWKADAVRPVSLAGLSFQILKTPPGFEVVIDKQKIPKDGVLSLDLYSGTGKAKKIFIYHELPREAFRAQTPDV
jgi:hypothetical protein